MDYDDMLADWEANYQPGRRVPAPAPARADDPEPRFTAREWARLRFLRALIHAGQLSEWDPATADQTTR